MQGTVWNRARRAVRWHAARAGHRMPAMRIRAALPAILLLILGACGSHEDAGKYPDPIYSPNGEPLTGGPLGYPGCAPAVARVDINHDGGIDLAEFLADARRQFVAMDLDGNGVITPATLARYRQPYLSRSGPDQGRANARRVAEPAGRRELDKINNDVPDPVMLADVNLRNKVTRADFLAYARSNFAQLDTGHRGRLDKAAVTRSSCG